VEWRERDGVRWLEAKLDGGRAAFSTRSGGVSGPPFDSLNLGLSTEDEEGAVVDNRLRLAAALRFPAEKVTFARQVHGTDLLQHDATPFTCSLSVDSNEKAQANAPVGDGHVLRQPRRAALVFVADCLPIALAGSGGVAMVHAGWRGLAGGIIGAGAGAVEATSAAIGPGIGPCCYAVGEEVLSAFSGLGDSVAAGPMLDLPEVARQLLARAGVEEVESAGLCTSCEEELFFSHRRDRGRTGRQAGIAWIDR
jgi:YfiH family protein